MLCSNAHERQIGSSASATSQWQAVLCMPDGGCDQISTKGALLFDAASPEPACVLVVRVLPQQCRNCQAIFTTSLRHHFWEASEAGELSAGAEPGLLHRQLV